MFTHTSPNLTPSRVVHIVHIVENLITGEMSDIDMLKSVPIFSDKPLSLPVASWCQLIDIEDYLRLK